jgi:hypothetical protein
MTRGRIPQEPRLAAGFHRLSRFPEFCFAGDADGFQRAQRIGAALRRNRLLDEFDDRLSRRRLSLQRAHEQREGRHYKT